MRVLILLLMLPLVSCRSGQKYSKDQSAKLVGKDESWVYACAGWPVEKRSFENFDVATWRYKKARSRLQRWIAGADTNLCEAKLRFDRGRVTRIDLSPAGATISNRHPLCLEIFKSCLQGRARRVDSGRGTAGSISSGVTEGIIDGIIKAGERINQGR